MARYRHPKFLTKKQTEKHTDFRLFIEQDNPDFIIYPHNIFDNLFTVSFCGRRCNFKEGHVEIKFTGFNKGVVYHVDYDHWKGYGMSIHKKFRCEKTLLKLLNEFVKKETKSPMNEKLLIRLEGLYEEYLTSRDKLDDAEIYIHLIKTALAECKYSEVGKTMFEAIAVLESDHFKNFREFKKKHRKRFKT